MRDCVYTEESDVCPMCHEVGFMKDNSESPVEMKQDVPLDLTQKLLCGSSASKIKHSPKRVNFHAHVKGYDNIYCWEYVDCTKACEFICVMWVAFAYLNYMG